MRALIAAVLLIGCGGKSDESEPEPPPLSSPIDAAPARATPTPTPSIVGLRPGMTVDQMREAIGAKVGEGVLITVVGTRQGRLDKVSPGLEAAAVEASSKAIGRRFTAAIRIGGKPADCVLDVLEELALSSITCDFEDESDTERHYLHRLVKLALTDKYGEPGSELYRNSDKGRYEHSWGLQWKGPRSTLWLKFEDQPRLRISLEHQRYQTALENHQAEADKTYAAVIAEGLAGQAEDPALSAIEALKKDL